VFASPGTLAPLNRLGPRWSNSASASERNVVCWLRGFHQALESVASSFKLQITTADAARFEVHAVARQSSFVSPLKPSDCVEQRRCRRGLMNQCSFTFRSEFVIERFDEGMPSALRWAPPASMVGRTSFLARS
jgi:hypothetical protein